MRKFVLINNEQPIKLGILVGTECVETTKSVFIEVYEKYASEAKILPELITVLFYPEAEDGGLEMVISIKQLEEY